MCNAAMQLIKWYEKPHIKEPKRRRIPQGSKLKGIVQNHFLWSNYAFSQPFP